MPKPSCCICHTTWSKVNYKLFYAPKNKERRRKWSESCGIELRDNSRICENHFSSGDFKVVDGCKRLKRTRLSRTALPSASFLRSTPDGPYYVDRDLDNLANLIEIKREALPPNEHDTTICSQLAERYTQTDTEIIESGTLLENIHWRREAKKLEAENLKLKAKLLEMENFQETVSNIFTERQIIKLKTPLKRIRWCWEDISLAISQYAASPNAYQHLYKRGFPLPSIATIGKWLQTVKINDGILHFVLDLLKTDCQFREEKDRLCILTIDEMKISAPTNGTDSNPLLGSENDNSNRMKLKNNFVQVAFVQGLKSSWNQPVYYEFDCKMSKAILYDIIAKLYAAGYPVVALVSKCNKNTLEIWKDLEISEEKTWFANPADENGQIYVFADATHLLHLLRNQYLETGIRLNKKRITKQTLKEVLHYIDESGEKKDKLFNLSVEHLTKNSKFQKSKLAVEFFSNNTTNAIRSLYSSGKDLLDPLETVDFIQQVRDWFDVFTSKFSAENTKPYGSVLLYQDQVLDNMNHMMSGYIISKEPIKASFQAAILYSNKSLCSLYEYLKKNYDIEHIYTSRINLDLLEKFFDTIKSNGGETKDLLSQSQFKYSLRKYLCGAYIEK